MIDSNYGKTIILIQKYTYDTDFGSATGITQTDEITEESDNGIILSVAENNFVNSELIEEEKLGEDLSSINVTNFTELNSAILNDNYKTIKFD